MESNCITKWNITSMCPDELVQRRRKIIAKLQENGLKGMMFFSAGALRYMTGGALIPTERPMVFILKEDESNVLLVPRLELEHAEHAAKKVDRIVCYPEYPGEKHPMNHLAELLQEIGLADAPIAADSDGYGNFWGYRGPKISDLCTGMKLTLWPTLVEEMKVIKSPYDQMVIKESCRWGNYAHQLMQDYTHAGAYELDVVTRASLDASMAMIKTLGPDFIPSSGLPAQAGYRGQIGKNSYFPHAMANNAMFKQGDTLVTGAGADLFGYNSELERVMFVGEPSKEQEKYYTHAVNLQHVAYNVIRPGIKCSDVDKEVQKYYKEHNLMEYWRHHTGHAVGFAGHEMPFFDINDNTIIEVGMVFTVEPGIYVEGLGGFRLSDTVLVTETGIEMLTYYPTDIDKVICGA